MSLNLQNSIILPYTRSICKVGNLKSSDVSAVENLLGLKFKQKQISGSRKKSPPFRKQLGMFNQYQLTQISRINRKKQE